jgi:hypothetical protein
MSLTKLSLAGTGKPLTFFTAFPRKYEKATHSRWSANINFFEASNKLQVKYNLKNG